MQLLQIYPSLLQISHILLQIFKGLYAIFLTNGLTAAIIFNNNWIILCISNHSKYIIRYTLNKQFKIILKNMG